jgi:hypothetical protein
MSVPAILYTTHIKSFWIDINNGDEQLWFLADKGMMAFVFNKRIFQLFATR